MKNLEQRVSFRDLFRKVPTNDYTEGDRYCF